MRKWFGRFNVAVVARWIIYHRDRCCRGDFRKCKVARVIRIAISWLRAKSIHGKRLRSPPKKAKTSNFVFLFSPFCSHTNLPATWTSCDAFLNSIEWHRFILNEWFSFSSSASREWKVFCRISPFRRGAFAWKSFEWSRLMNFTYHQPTKWDLAAWATSSPIHFYLAEVLARRRLTLTKVEIPLLLRWDGGEPRGKF